MLTYIYVSPLVFRVIKNKAKNLLMKLHALLPDVINHMPYISPYSLPLLHVPTNLPNQKINFGIE